MTRSAEDDSPPTEFVHRVHSVYRTHIFALRSLPLRVIELEGPSALIHVISLSIRETARDDTEIPCLRVSSQFLRSGSLG